LAAGRYGNELLLAAGTEYGDISVLDFLNQDVKWWVPGAHVRGIPVLSFNQINNRAMLVSGGLDGVVRFWTARTGTPLLDIEIGEAITAATWVGATNLAVGTHRGVLMLQLSHDVITRLLD
jgi:WD40 repeat protein